ncbi:AMP-dependent synthetase and ligase family protein [Striga asiatica]|uniref:AMP-dependent synthetase and ligase family protein n=1 Tax=Striga asiatica TaxID=4170 RepID=A0A5A7R8S5_STRAF|nr:AMP-dependent synthetase and ligase family protein [Striga asiatica]
MVNLCLRRLQFLLVFHVILRAHFAQPQTNPLIDSVHHHNCRHEAPVELVAQLLQEIKRAQNQAKNPVLRGFSPLAMLFLKWGFICKDSTCGFKKEMDLPRKRLCGEDVNLGGSELWSGGPESGREEKKENSRDGLDIRAISQRLRSVINGPDIGLSCLGLLDNLGFKIFCSVNFKIGNSIFWISALILEELSIQLN